MLVMHFLSKLHTIYVGISILMYTLTKLTLNLQVLISIFFLFIDIVT